MEKTPDYEEHNTRDPRNPPLPLKKIKKEGEKEAEKGKGKPEKPA